MSKLSLRNLAGASAMALAFAGMAQADIINNPQQSISYTGHLSKAIRNATNDLSAEERTGSLIAKMERSFQKPSDAAYRLKAIDEALVTQLQIYGVVPPTALLTEEKIRVCAEKDGKVKWIGTIDYNTGKVAEVLGWTGQVAADAPNGSACKGFNLTAYNEIMTKLAQTNSPKPSAEAPKPQVVGMAPQQ